MMVVAPSWAAARTPLRPTAPSPTTTTLVPGWTPAETAACQPVHITSERASRLGIRSASGCPGVAIRVPSALGMRIFSAWHPSKPPPCWQLACMPLRQTGHVLSLCRKPPTTKSPTFTVVTASPTCSTIPTYSCPIGVAAVTCWIPR